MESSLPPLPGDEKKTLPELDELSSLSSDISLSDDFEASEEAAGGSKKKSKKVFQFGDSTSQTDIAKAFEELKEVLRRMEAAVAQIDRTPEKALEDMKTIILENYEKVKNASEAREETALKTELPAQECSSSEPTAEVASVVKTPDKSPTDRKKPVNGRVELSVVDSNSRGSAGSNVVVGDIVIEHHREDETSNESEERDSAEQAGAKSPKATDETDIQNPAPEVKLEAGNEPVEKQAITEDPVAVDEKSVPIESDETNVEKSEPKEKQSNVEKSEDELKSKENEETNEEKSLPEDGKTKSKENEESNLQEPVAEDKSSSSN